MGEIKSTIDLAMEKTEGLTLSDEEKQRLEQEKDLRRSQALVKRYLKGDVSLEELLRNGHESVENVQQSMIRSLVEGLRPGRQDFSRGLEALEQWKGRSCRAQLKRLRDLSIQFGKALSKRKKKVRSVLWAELARKGVEGSAVEPNVEVSSQWTAATRELEREFDPRLEQIKKELLNQTGIF